jgi:hypothetical protein
MIFQPSASLIQKLKQYLAIQIFWIFHEIVILTNVTAFPSSPSEFASTNVTQMYRDTIHQYVIYSDTIFHDTI